MIGFAAPWVLAALVILPGLWWLLRVTPPAPRLVRFPAIRLLRDLPPREETPARTPLWLVLLRMLLAALLIIGLAGPILRPGAAPPGRGPEILIVDTGWEAGENWPAIRAALLDEIDRAGRAGLSVVLLPTARSAAGDPVDAIGPLTAGEARTAAEALAPSPWAPDTYAAAAILGRFDGRSSALWLSDGIADPGVDNLAKAVAGFDGARVLTPKPAALPILVLPPAPGAELAVTIRRAVDGVHPPVTLLARGQDGRILGQAFAAFEGGGKDARAVFDLPTDIRNEVARIDIAGARNVGSVVLLDDRERRRPVGIVTAAADADSNALLNGGYYLKRALEPFADVRTGDVATLLKDSLAMLVVTDSVALTLAERRAIADWMAQGGLLLRFAGPNLAGEDPVPDDPLVPTELRTGARSLAGAMSWTKPATLAPFPEDGPFAGLEPSAEVTVSQQILAEPTLDLDRKVWARLADGTPLITADKRGKGAVVLVHTSADPSWSNLALSGLFPQMLRRIVSYSVGAGRAPAHGALEPASVLDGFARLQSPGGAVAAAAADGFEQIRPDSSHPPGYYGAPEARRALNLTQTLTEIAPLGSFPPRLSARTYESSGEVSIGPWLLGAALALAAVDTLIALLLGGSLPKRPRRLLPARLLALLLTLVLASVTSARAEPAPAPPVDPKVIEAASQVTLGYVETGDAATDRLSREGLAGLTHQLTLRTSIDHAAPAAVSLERDELSVYPLLYWVISPQTAPLSDHAKAKLNRYLSTGGVILIDTRAGAGRGIGGGAPDLSKAIQGINIPALIPVPNDHVLTKSFYLLDNFPGRLAGGAVWVERDQDTNNDGVSSVVVGSADWAGAWAVDPSSGQPVVADLAGGEHQREWAYRFGVNLVMYALTGNYKADLVHVPFIKQRLGQ